MTQRREISFSLISMQVRLKWDIVNQICINVLPENIYNRVILPHCSTFDPKIKKVFTCQLNVTLDLGKRKIYNPEADQNCDFVSVGNLFPTTDYNLNQRLNLTANCCVQHHIIPPITKNVVNYHYMSYLYL